MRRIALGVLAILVLTQSFSAVATQTVGGTVVDTSRAALPGATITLQTANVPRRSTVTNASGAFRFDNVPIGRVTITAALTGFNTATRTLQVAADRPSTLTIVLAVGQVSEHVVVAAEAPNLTAGIRRGHRRGADGGVAGGIAGGGIGVDDYRRRSAPWNTEAYDRIDDNPFHRSADQPLSTFSIDVDTASYANVRRFLNEGHRPPPDAVRTEELINYFGFDYPSPPSGQPISITTEVTSCPWNSSHRVALIGLQTRAFESAATPPRNLVFLIDVSGSMMPADKLPLVKTAMRMLADTLDARDRIAIVVYAGASGLVLPSTPGDRKESIRRALDDLDAGGSTNGAEGIRLAYDTAAAQFIRGGINRVILATDGDFNVGVTSQGDLIRLIEEERQRGIFLSVLGVGTGNVKDSTMEKLADKGNGNYAYLDSLHEARRVLIQQAGATLATVAKDVKVQIEFNPATVNAYRLIGYENRLLQKEDFNDDTKDAGEVGAGQSVTALYEIVPAGVAIDLPAVDRLKYQQPSPVARNSEDLMTVKVRYKEPDGDSSTLLTVPVANAAGPMTPRIGFAAAVAEFGMLLRESPHKGGATWDAAAQLGRRYRGEDAEGYRAEFIRLVELAGALDAHPKPIARR